MTPAELKTLLEDVREGRVAAGDAHTRLLERFREQPFEDLGFARIDHHRSIRQGFPEVILGIGKTPEQIAEIAARIVNRGQPLLVTRVEEAGWLAVRERIPEAEYHPQA